MKNIKKLVLIIAFIVISICIAASYHHYMNFKYTDIATMKAFYGCKEDSIDVIFYGSSHIYENVNTAVLWDNYGIASFDLGSSKQPIWNTYHYMKESFKTQTPKLAVVDCYMLARQTDEYADMPGIVKATFGMKLSKNKLEAIKVSVPKGGDLRAYMLEYPVYHSRYSDVNEDDYLDSGLGANASVFKGHLTNVYTEPQIEPAIADIYEPGQLLPKNEEYLRKLIGLCAEKNVPLLLVNSPYVVSEEDMSLYSAVSNIASEYGVPFIDYNHLYNDIGIDYSTDYADIGHLNYKGNVKYTNALGALIKSAYDIPDRRGDKLYSDYDALSRDNAQLILDDYIKDTYEYNAYMTLLLSGDYTYVCYYPEALRADECDIAAYNGSNLLFKASSDGSVIEGKEYIDNDGYNYVLNLGKYDVINLRYTDKLRVKVNAERIDINPNEMMIIVYDNIRKQLVETVHFVNDEGGEYLKY